jgi:hypothetical protein
VRRRRIVAASIAAALAVVAIIVVWLAVIRGGAAPVSVEEVVAGFEGEGGPGVGVYVYDTEGEESVDALFGSAHDYPARTTIAVTEEGCGTLLRWTPLEGRTQTYEICPVEGGLELAAYRETHTFLGQTTRTEYRCEPGSPWLLPDRETFVRHCSTADTTETARGRIIGRETIAVDGHALETYHVRLDTTLEGKTRGKGSQDWWLLPASGLPVRLVLANDNATGSPIGDVRYRERLELALAQVEPLR